MTDVLALDVAVAALLVAGVSAFYARRQAVHTLEQAVESSELRKIETQRRHDDLTPVFEVSLTTTSGDPNMKRPRLSVHLKAPVTLGRLDKLTVKVRDDKAGRTQSDLSYGPSAEQVAAQVWGPYRIVPGTDGADPTGRTAQSGPPSHHATLATSRPLFTGTGSSRQYKTIPQSISKKSLTFMQVRLWSIRTCGQSGSNGRPRMP